MIFIGCDGGSTKTEWLLCNERGRVLAIGLFPAVTVHSWVKTALRG